MEESFCDWIVTHFNSWLIRLCRALLWKMEQSLSVESKRVYSATDAFANNGTFNKEPQEAVWLKYYLSAETTYKANVM